MTLRDGEYAMADGAVQQTIPGTIGEAAPDSTACQAYVCSQRCQKFVPGRKLGRDTAPSCAVCTHTEQSHRPAAGERTVR